MRLPVSERVASDRVTFPPPQCYTPAELDQVQKLSKLRVTRSSEASVGGDGRLRLRLPLAGNGANLVVITPH